MFLKKGQKTILIGHLLFSCVVMNLRQTSLLHLSHVTDLNWHIVLCVSFSFLRNDTAHPRSLNSQLMDLNSHNVECVSYSPTFPDQSHPSFVHFAKRLSRRILREILTGRSLHLISLLQDGHLRPVGGPSAIVLAHVSQNECPHSKTIGLNIKDVLRK